MLYALFLASLVFNLSQAQPAQKDLTGAWTTSASDGTKGLLIVTEEHFSITYYKSEPATFQFTGGGKWELLNDGTVKVLWEFHTSQKELVGQTEDFPINIQGDKLNLMEEKWQKADSGKPGKLSGAWLITGRDQDGKMSTMTPGARKTMKIMSGTKFQWIAYNSETGEFMGTGGGSYTTKDGKYTENIEFFSRDNTRVGASLEFNFELKDGKWHHSGKSSKGDPIYEIWSTRQEVGI